MGYQRHHAIVVTSWDEKLVGHAHAMASDIFPAVSPLLESEVNGFTSFFVPPDGSNEGWSESDGADARRARFVAWLDTQRYDDDSTSISWVEVQYGDENGQTRIVSDSDARVRA